MKAHRRSGNFKGSRLSISPSHEPRGHEAKPHEAEGVGVIRRPGDIDDVLIAVADVRGDDHVEALRFLVERVEIGVDG